MTEIDRSHMAWILYQKEERYFLSVVCGGVGIFEVVIQFSRDESVLYKRNGKIFVDSFASNVRSNPSKYQERAVIDFDKNH